MKTSRLNTTIFVIVLVLVVWAVLWAQNAKIAPPSSFVPETITILRLMEDSALVCVEPVRGDIVRCKTVGEVRKWIEMEGRKATAR